jgi:hypothetical protein
MTQMKNKLIAFAFLGSAAAFLNGCIPMRTVSYPDHSYDTVFKSAVSGLCAEKQLVVYEADKRKGLIKLESRSVWGNTRPQVFIYGAGGGTPSITVRGRDTWLEDIIAKNLPAGKAGVSKSPGKKTLNEDTDMDLERQKLELEKEKLKFEREKLEFEKQKQKGK